jgi:hypothetical protein
VPPLQEDIALVVTHLQTNVLIKGIVVTKAVTVTVVNHEINGG